MKFDYVSVLLGGIYKSTGNMSPFDSLRGVKNRLEYQALETQRFLRRRTEAAQFQLMQQVLKNWKSSDERIAMDFHYYEPSKGHGLRHNPFNAIIAPRPIGWISSLNANGQANLAPYSFFNAFLYDPAIIGFSSISWKDTVKNVAETREFVWNLVTKELGDQMNKTSAPFEYGVSEFDVAGLTALPSRHVSVPRVGESRAAMECKVIDVIRLRHANGEPAEGWLVLGEVVAVYIDKALIKDGVYQTALANPILRAGRGGDYVEVTEDRVFEMTRPPGSSHPDFHGAKY